MKGSYRLFSIGGIEVRLHITLLLFLLLPLADLIESPAYAEYVFVFLAVLFSSVLIHELAHSLVAIRSKIEVKRIILWPLGGLASIDTISDPGKEFRITIAGPLSSLCIGLFLLAVLVYIAGTAPVLEAITSGVFLSEPSLFNLAILAAYINIVLGAFNLFLPIFPMDGGRVLRSMLSMVTDRLTSTRIAVAVGQVFLVVFVLLAIMAGSLWLIAMGAFLFMAGLSELRITELSIKAGREDLSKVISTGFIAVDPGLKVSDFLEITAPWQTVYPVIDKSGRLIGSVEPGGRLANGSGTVGDVMDREPPAGLLERKDELLAKVYQNGYVFVLERDGSPSGILTLQNLQNSLQVQQLVRSKTEKTPAS